MASSSALSAAGLDICDLRQIVRLDMAASNELQKRIDHVRYDIKGGNSLPEATVETMENLNKDMTRDLVSRIEKIERSGPPTSVDREMLQALSARLAVCDRQGMQLTELRDLDKEMKRERENVRLPNVPLPLGGTPRKPSRASALYTPEGSPPTSFNIPPPPPYSAVHGSQQQFGIPAFTPPSSSSPRSNNPSLDRVSSQNRQRRSCEIRREHSYVPPSPPMGSNTSPLPSPRLRTTAAQPSSPRPGSSTRRPRVPIDVKRNASFPMTEGSSIQNQFSPRRDSAKSGHGEYQFYSYADYSDSESELSIPSDHEKSSWPLLYRILDIDPSTDPDVLLLVAKRELEKLSLKHNPARVPEDREAPRRWEAINTAYDVLTHPERKRVYDAGRREPVEALGVELAELRI